MTFLARCLLTVVAALALSCGSTQPAADPSCQTSCDCKGTSAPKQCPGEWACNANKLCEYTCRGTCAEGAPYTCRDGEECNGSICSEKTTCP